MCVCVCGFLWSVSVCVIHFLFFFLAFRSLHIHSSSSVCAPFLSIPTTLTRKKNEMKWNWIRKMTRVMFDPHSLEQIKNITHFRWFVLFERIILKRVHLRDETWMFWRMEWSLRCDDRSNYNATKLMEICIGNRIEKWWNWIAQTKQSNEQVAAEKENKKRKKEKGEKETNAKWLLSI